MFSLHAPASDRKGPSWIRRQTVLTALVATSLALPATGALVGGAHAEGATAVAAGRAIPRLDAVAPGSRLVPAPVSLRRLSGPAFRIGPRTRVVVVGGSPAVRVGSELAQRLRRSTGFRLPLLRREHAPLRAVVLRVRPAAELPGVRGKEGYRLVARRGRLVLDARTAEGLFRGVQTLRQLLPPQIESRTVRPGPWTVPAVRIVDYPRFRYRGAMLDVVRHFMTVKEVERYIDDIALYKLNRLHLHLSDDQGWRLEIKGWPRLTRYGGTTEVANGPGGWYTQAQYSRIVRYAARRFITVVPEFDTPSHTNAALASYPQLTCDGVAPPLYTGIEVGFSSLCIDKKETYSFLDDVVRQLARLTPGRYLHLGGDEAHSTAEADYVKFVQRVQKIVRRHGKRMMGWAETSAAQLDPTNVAQYWNPASGSDPGTETAVNAVRQGIRLVMSPANKAYLDMKYTDLTPLGQSWAGIVEVADSYDWDPVSYVSGIDESDVLGVEAPVWTETLKDIRDVEYMAFPRLPGVAEKGWSPAGHTWGEYRRRLAAQSARWEVLGTNYYCSPQVDWYYCRTRPVAPGGQ